MKTMNKVLELATRISYRSHRVVRKPLMITPKRNMALLAFDKGKNLLTSSVPMDVRFIFPEEKAELVVDGVKLLNGYCEFVNLPVEEQGAECVVTTCATVDAPLDDAVAEEHGAHACAVGAQSCRAAR